MGGEQREVKSVFGSGRLRSSEQSRVAAGSTPVPTTQRSATQEKVRVRKTHLWRVAHVFSLLDVGNIGVHDHTVKSPVLALVGSRDFLLHSREETLRVEEACHPERCWAAFCEPCAVLPVAQQQSAVPRAQIGGEPGELVASRAEKERGRGGGRGRGAGEG